VPAKEIIRSTLDGSDRILKKYVDDLNDADLLVRPVEGMNHIAWQLGHLIWAERWFVEMVKPGVSPPLPEGFKEKHDKEGHESDAGFATKAEYLSLWDAQRSATKKVLDDLSEEELAQPGPERFRTMAETVGALLNFAGTHALMHLGQFAAVRRKLKKPIVI
jgi:uncharacterized damage-inducible protein DinB